MKKLIVILGPNGVGKTTAAFVSSPAPLLVCDKEVKEV